VKYYAEMQLCPFDVIGTRVNETDARCLLVYGRTRLRSGRGGHRTAQSEHDGLRVQSSQHVLIVSNLVFS